MSFVREQGHFFPTALDFNRAMLDFRVLPEAGDVAVPIAAAEAETNGEATRRLSTMSWDETVAWHDSFCWQAERSALRIEKGSGWLLTRAEGRSAVGRELALRKRSLLDISAADFVPSWRSRFLPNAEVRTYFRNGGVGIETVRTPQGFRTERIALTVSEKALVENVSTASWWPLALRLEYFALFPERLMRAAAQLVADVNFAIEFPWVNDAQIRGFVTSGAGTFEGVALAIADTEDFIATDHMGLFTTAPSAAVTIVRQPRLNGGALYQVVIANPSQDATRMGLQGIGDLIFKATVEANEAEIPTPENRLGAFSSKVI